MKKNQIIGLVVAIVIALGLAGAGWAAWGGKLNNSAQTAQTASPSPSTQTKTLSYQGVDGKTALELLKAKDPKAVTKGDGSNAYVTTINGYTANDTKKEYWAFYVNGKMSDVGAGSYVTKSADNIEWKLATY